MTPDSSRRKEARLAMRLAPDQDALIRHAAAITGQSLTEFVKTATVTRAVDTLADRRVLRLDDAAWTRFAAILDRPARRITELSELLNEPAPLGQMNPQPPYPTAASDNTTDFDSGKHSLNRYLAGRTLANHLAISRGATSASTANQTRPWATVRTTARAVCTPPARPHTIARVQARAPVQLPKPGLGQLVQGAPHRRR